MTIPCRDHTNEIDSSFSQGAPDIHYLFYPRAVAHVGASAKEVIGRFNFSDYLLQMNYTGNIYPVNPKYENICGLRCYPDLSAVPENIDIAIMAIPAEDCASALRNIPPGKIKFVVIHTSGFREIDKGKLEDELLSLAGQKGFRIVGPNCMGVYSQEGKIGFWEDHHEIVKNPGGVGMISQSGGHAINCIRGGLSMGLYFDKVVSLGNQLDLTIVELLEYFSKDPQIDTIGIYVEQVGKGRRFLELLKETTIKKPVVVWYGGMTGAGKAAAASHTASLAGNEEIFQAAMRQAGAIMPKDRTEFLQLLRLLQKALELPCENLAVISPGGGNTVSICDMIAAQKNLNLPLLSEATQGKLKTILPEENVDIKNPVDPGATGYPVLEKLITYILEDPGIESLMINIETEIFAVFESEEKRISIADKFGGVLNKIQKSTGKPIHVLVIQHRQNNADGDAYRRLFINKLNEYNVPWIGEPFSLAARTYAKLAGYRNYLNRRRRLFPA